MRVSKSFDDLLRARLTASKSEAARQVLAAERSGRRLGDAILDAIESLPKRSTKELRGWLDDTPLLFAKDIYKYGGAFVRSFNETETVIDNPYAGKVRVRLRANMYEPYVDDDRNIRLHVTGKHIWLDEKEPTHTQFSLYIVVRPSDLRVTISQQGDVPKDMLDGLRDALDA